MSNLESLHASAARFDSRLGGLEGDLERLTATVMAAEAESR